MGFRVRIDGAGVQQLVSEIEDRIKAAVQDVARTHGECEVDEIAAELTRCTGVDGDWRDTAADIAAGRIATRLP